MSMAVLSVLLMLILTGCNEPSSNKIDAQMEQATTSLASAPIESPVATTQYGQIRGFTEHDILAFKGIRYGADTALNRFMPPQPPESWTGIKDALSYGNSTRQSIRTNSIGLFTSWGTNPTPDISEDCLFLNVWTPALADTTKRPVLVWFHGGGFSTGSGSSNAYDGVRLAKRGDAVVVTVNHRLNVFGYLYLAGYGEKFADSGNVGILDLIQSLKWVRDNIAEFGGDPENVMIFGESGGGFKVSDLLAMDAAKGLFHRAVIQSGPWLKNVAAADATKAAEAIVQKLGLTNETIDRISTMPAEEIEQAVRDVVTNGTPLRLAPVFDNRNFNRDPFDPDAPMQSKDVPLLIGTTRTEMSLLAGARRTELFDLTWDNLPAALEQGLEDVDANAVIAGYRELRPDLDAPELYFTAITDNGFFRRSVQMADRKADMNAAPVYFYLFDWNTPVDDGKWKAPHALEIGFVFDNVEKSASMSGTGEDQQIIADMMSESWLAFARTGNPNNVNAPMWQPYTSQERATMVVNVESKLVNDPRREFMKLLDGK
jgi:para-nitrobenzyl esterase